MRQTSVAGRWFFSPVDVDLAVGRGSSDAAGNDDEFMNLNEEADGLFLPQAQEIFIQPYTIRGANLICTAARMQIKDFSKSPRVLISDLHRALLLSLSSVSVASSKWHPLKLHLRDLNHRKDQMSNLLQDQRPAQAQAQAQDPPPAQPLPQTQPTNPPSPPSVSSHLSVLPAPPSVSLTLPLSKSNPYPSPSPVTTSLVSPKPVPVKPLLSLYRSYNHYGKIHLLSTAW